MASLSSTPVAEGAPRVPTTVLFVSDVQERFRSVIRGFSALLDGAVFLCKSAVALGVPMVVTEQYPKAFGPTVPEVLAAVEGGTVARAEKTQFSMLTPEVAETAFVKAATHAIVVGLETHICVLQTTRDLVARGVTVYVVVDAVSSQRELDRSVALQRLSAMGAVLTTSESIVYELLADSKHPAFKTVAALVKDRAAALAVADSPATGLQHL